MKRNKFSLSHYKLLTGDMGYLIPITHYEALPGDTLQMSNSVLIRSTPLVAPVMHPVRVRLHSFFVPYRILWDDWENFITGGEDGKFEAQPPTIVINSVIEKSTLHDYLGVPVGDYNGDFMGISALPFRAYATIYNEYYRDQDLISELTVSKTSGNDALTSQDIQRVAWQKDYFTSARPWAALGNEVLIPIGDKAPLKGIGIGTQDFTGNPSSVYESGATEPREYLSARRMDQTDGWWEEDSDNTGYPSAYADLSAVTGISVNDLRNYLALQRYQEARAQFGSRYSEYLKYLVPGIGNLDSRLQEPEYIHGGSSTISFSEVLQTDKTETEGTPLANMAGHGIAAMRTRRARKFCPEHGIVMTLLSVVPKSIYANALHRSWVRTNKEAYFQKELQFIGEQPIMDREVYAKQSTMGTIFGYQHRYDEYRYHPSTIHGDFTDSTANSWHYARNFLSQPALNQQFIECAPTKTPHADQLGDQLYMMVNNSIQARRILSKWSTPKTF